MIITPKRIKISDDNTTAELKYDLPDIGKVKIDVSIEHTGGKFDILIYLKAQEDACRKLSDKFSDMSKIFHESATEAKFFYDRSIGKRP